MEINMEIISWEMRKFNKKSFLLNNAKVPEKN